MQQPQQQPGIGLDAVSQGLDSFAAVHTPAMQQQGASGLALVNQQLAAQVLIVYNIIIISAVPQVGCGGGLTAARLLLQGSRLQLDDRGALWLLPATASSVAAAQSCAMLPACQAAMPQNSAAAAPGPEQQPAQQQNQALQPDDKQRIAAAAVRAAAAAAAAFGETGVPQSIGAAAAILENGGLPQAVCPQSMRIWSHV
jgi:hypothetical protein